MSMSSRALVFAELPGIAALITLSALFVLCAAPASAQILILGQYSGANPGPSGTATISGAGTAAGGTYKFLGGADAMTTQYGTVTLNHASTLTLLGGGAISNTLSNFNTSTADIDGGSVGTVKGYDSSVTNVYGGTVSSLTALGSSLGGLPGSGLINVYGGNLSTLTAQNGGVIDIFGTGLTETFFASSGVFQIYDVAGTLQDGTAFQVKYAGSGGMLLFDGQLAVPGAAPVPEASTDVSFGLLLVLGCGSLVAAARKKRVTEQAA